MNVIGKTADGAFVVDRHNSHLHDEIKDFIVDALARVHTGGRPFLEAEVTFGHIVGNCICVSTSSNDKIVYAQRPNRKGLTRFVMDRDAEPTTKAMVVLKKSENPREYILITAFAGGKSELEPWDPRATPESLIFWQNKALIWGQPILEGTTSSECPWG